MYSRFPSREEKPLRVPEHYSGCAFSKNPYPPPAPKPPPEKPPERPLPPQEHPPKPAPPPPPPKPKPAPHESYTPTSSLLGSFSPHGLSLPLGMDFDELLLIGLILLLSHSEKDSDIILWLALLLFCK